MIGTMIWVCSLTNDAEKAIKLFEEMKNLPSVRLTCSHYDVLLKALSSRWDYC